MAEERRACLDRRGAAAPSSQLGRGLSEVIRLRGRSRTLAVSKESGVVVMAVVAHVVLPGVSQEQYDKVREACGWLTNQPGGLSHLTWWEGNDCHNMDAWESEAAFQAFGETRLGPAMAKAGVNVEPKVTFHPAHEVYLPKAVTITS